MQRDAETWGEINEGLFYKEDPMPEEDPLEEIREQVSHHHRVDADTVINPAISGIDPDEFIDLLED